MGILCFQSGEPGDLVFEAGELVLVSSKDGDWWTGQCLVTTYHFSSISILLFTVLWNRLFFM
jgi:hypothetical protein